MKKVVYLNCYLWSQNYIECVIIKLLHPQLNAVIVHRKQTPCFPDVIFHPDLRSAAGAWGALPCVPVLAASHQAARPQSEHLPSSHC